MFLNLKHSSLKSISVNQVKSLTNYNLYFPITEEGNKHVFSHKSSSIQRNRAILFIHVLRATKRGASSGINPNAVFASCFSSVDRRHFS